MVQGIPIPPCPLIGWHADPLEESRASRYCVITIDPLGKKQPFLFISNYNHPVEINMYNLMLWICKLIWYTQFESL